MKWGSLQLPRFSQFISFCFPTFGHQSVILIFEEEYSRRSVWLDKQGKDDCEGGCRLAGGAGPPLSGRDTHNAGQSALCARMDRYCGDNVPRESLNSQWTNARVMLHPPQWVFSGSQARDGLGLDYQAGGGYKSCWDQLESGAVGGGGQKVSNLRRCCCKRQIFRDNPAFCASRMLRFRVWCQTERFIGREWNESRLAFTCRSVRSRAAAISIRRGLRAKNCF